MNTSLGYRHYQRQERMDKLKERIGNGLLWYFAGMFTAWLLMGTPAHAATPKSYELVLAIFTIADGHTPDDKSYRDIIHVSGFHSEMECLLSGQRAQDRFVATRDKRRMSQDMLAYTCQSVFE